MMAGVNQQTREEPPDEFVGYGDAAAYLGMKRNTLTAYCSPRRRPDGTYADPIGPTPLPDKRVVKGWAMPVFPRAELDRWRNSRPGQGARTDLLERPARVRTAA